MKALENEAVDRKQASALKGDSFSFPLTHAQRQLWFLQELDPANVSYNIQWAIRLSGELHAAALERSLNEIVRRHESLRTTFRAYEGEPRQIVAGEMAIPLPVTNLGHLGHSEREAEALRLKAEEAAQIPNLARGPLLRARLIRLDPSTHVLLLTLHHIVFDAWSRRIFTRELAALYEAYRNDKPSPLSPPDLQYADYAVWQVDHLQGGRLEKELAYWKQQLAGAPARLALETDHPRPPVPTSNGSAIPLDFLPGVAAGLAVLSRKHNASLFMTLLAGFAALLSRYTGQNDLVVGTPVANRNRPETEGIIGLFANTVVLRTDLSGDPDFGEIIKRVKRIALNAYAHQELPFEKLVEELNPARSLSNNPLFEIMFSAQRAAPHGFELGGLKLQVVDGSLATARFDISVLILESAEGMSGRIEYRTDLFDKRTVEQMAAHYLTLLEEVVKNPTLRLSELPLLTPSERRRILTEWNLTETEYPRRLCVHELFEQQAERAPEAPACLFEESRVSYRELNARADHLANRLQRHGVCQGRRVGIFLERTPELLVALLGILKSGAAYVAIDPSYPPSHIHRILREVQLDALVTDRGLRVRLPDGLAPDAICIEDGESFARERHAKREGRSRPEDTAYVTLVSGSAGQLLELETSHRAVVNLTWCMSRQLAMEPGDVTPALASHGSDLCVPELYVPLITGGCIAFPRIPLVEDGDRLASFLRASKATVVHASPHSWESLLQAGFDGRGLKRVIGARALSQKLCARLLDADPSLYCYYGFAEATVWSAFHHFRSGAESATIGRPVANTRIYILDARRQPVPVGVAGELYIAGDGVARGYAGRPELTAERFPEDPFHAGERMYRTGEVAKFLPNGQIQLLRQALSPSAILENQLVFWKKNLGGAPALHSLPTDRPRTSMRAFGVARCHMDVPGGVRAGLIELSRTQSVSLFVTLLTAFSILLARYSGQEDIVVGSQGVGRSPSEDGRLTGLFNNIFALRICLSGELRVRELLQHVQAVVASAHANLDLPFSKVVEELQPERSPNRHSLFQVMFNLVNVEPVAREPDLATYTSGLDLAVVATETAAKLRIAFEYSTDLFDASTIARIGEHLQNLLRGAANDSEQIIWGMLLPGSYELRQQLEEWNATDLAYPNDACVHDLLNPVARRQSRRTAVVYEGRYISYGRLNERSNQLARYLRKCGVKPGSLVGVFLPRSIEMVIGLLGVLKAGGAYVPLDPAHPKERISMLLEDTRMAVILTQPSISELLPIQGAQRIYLDDTRSEIDREAVSELPGVAGPDDLAYVIFTSGSTGRPKGVQITHRNLVNFLTSMQREPGFSAGDVLLAVTTLSFDIAGLEIFLPLVSGGKVIIASREEATQVDKLKRLLAGSEATVLQATPATWRMLVDSGWNGAPQLKALCGGEALPADLASELRPRCLELWNMYGPTETTIWSSIFKVTEDVSITVPIGRPIANTQFYILDRNRQPVPVGVTGELFIGGLGVARGYLNREELTAQKFLLDPFRRGGRMYRTGDQARFNPDGNVQYLGRADDQVKVRGHRIELGEIESALGRHPGIRDCVVVLKDETQGQRLIAYVVLRSEREISDAEIENHLKKTLPDYMIPSIVRLDTLPLTPAGKIDRRALPMPGPITARPDKASGPRDELEMAVLEIWERLLGIQNCAMTDNFFELGGHSLLLVRLSAMIEKEFHETVPLSFLFGSATIEKIAAYLRDSRTNKSGFFLPFNQTGSKPAFYCVHALVGDAISCRHLAKFLNPEQDFYGIEIPPALRTSEFVTSVESIAQRYVAELLEFDPAGPYILGGWSAGVPIALEMAQQLERLGHEVPLVVVIDSAPANTGAGSHRLSPGYNAKLIRNIPRWAADDLARNFSWRDLYRRARRKLKGFIGGIPISRRSAEEMTQYRAKALVTASAYSESTNAFMRTFSVTLAKYIPKPYSGHVVLYKARTEPLFKVRELDLKWKKIASRLDVVDVKGTHNTVLEESNVPLLAADLNARLRHYRRRALRDANSREPEIGGQYGLGGTIRISRSHG